jgi:hypothetical protein
MKFTFKKLPPLNQDDYIIDCDCSGPCECDGVVVCSTNAEYVTPGGSVGPSQFEIDYEDGVLCGESCGGFLMSGQIPDFGSPYLLNNYFNIEQDLCPALGMRVGCSLPCIVSTGSPPEPVSIFPRAFVTSIEDMPRFYQRFSGAFPMEAYSSLPPGESELKMAKVDVSVDTVRRRDRMMILSGFNRYRYLGPLAVNCLDSNKWETMGMADGYNYDEYVGLSGAANDGALVSWKGDLVDPPSNCSPGSPQEITARTVPVYGIIELEKRVHGEYPHPDWKARLPILGATNSDNPVLPPKECCPKGTPCFTYDCLQCIEPFDEETAMSEGDGYFQFPFRNSLVEQFNPDSHIGPLSEPTGDRIQTPHCSLYSLIWAIRNYAFAYADLNLGDWFLRSKLSPVFLDWNGACTTRPDNVNGAPGSDGSPWWYDKDPLKFTDGKMNVFFVMERIQNALPGFGPNGWLDESSGNFLYQNTKLKWRIPRVLLWDPDGYLAAAEPKDKWKHIYVVGHLNVIYDSGCVSTLGDAGGLCRRTRGMILDSTSHRDGANGSPESCRLLLWPMCGCEDQHGEPGGQLDPPESFSMSMQYLPCNYNHCAGAEQIYWFGGFTGEDEWCFNNNILMDYTEAEAGSDPNPCGRPECP